MLPAGRAARRESEPTAFRVGVLIRTERRIREMHWWPAIARTRLPEDIATRLDGEGVLGPLRVTAAARRLRRLLSE